jgi:hypothetical protein
MKGTKKMSLTTSEMSPADFAAVCGGNNSRSNGDDMFGGNGAWWIIILLLFGFGGRGGYGSFGGGQGGGYAQPIVIDSGRLSGCGCGCCATPADVRAAVDQQTLISKLDQQTYGLADSTYALNNNINQNFRGVDNAICNLGFTIQGGFNGVDNAICNLGYNVQGGFNSLSHQISDCCCQTQRAIDRVAYENQSNTCALQNTIQNTTRDIIDNANANSRAVLDFLVKDKIDTLQSENLALRFQASQTAQNSFITANQEAQTAELIRRLDPRPCPQPAYVVQPPTPVTFPTNCCGQVQYANSGCGCGNY